MRAVATVITLTALAAVLAAAAETKKSTANRKPVTSFLTAKWSSTPFHLEMSEILADEDPNAFWEMVEFLVEERHSIGKSLSDRELYEKCVSFASRFLTASQTALMKLSLSLRTHSPRIEMFQQIAKDRGVEGAKCGKGYVVDFGGELHCDVGRIDFEKKGDSGPGPQLFNTDHVYPHEKESAPVAILYGGAWKLHPDEFAEAHETLKKLAGEGVVKYVLRPYLVDRPQEKTRMSGYGVELQIKKTEYKAQDDAKLDAGGQASDGDLGEEEEKDVDGFKFDTLSERHPGDKEKLSEFKQHLLDQQNDLPPMKVWQLQDLSMQAATKIMEAPKDEQLKTLNEIAQNFPSHAKSLSKIKVPKEMKKEVRKNQEVFLTNMNLQTSDAALFINGMYFDMDYVDMFTVMDTLKSEGKVLDGLGDLGMTDEQARAMISQDLSSSEKQTYGIDIRDTAVNWINDIEKDKLYAGWPAGVGELLRPTFPGMMRSIRKNFFNIVIMCDPSRKDSRALLKNLEAFYVHRAPTRIGIVFTVNDSPEVSGMDDAGVALLDAFNYISGNSQPYDALAFITDVFAKVGDTADVTAKSVHDLFAQNYPKAGSLEDIFGEDSEFDVGRQLAADFFQRSGFKETPQVLMNGVPFDKKNLEEEEFEESVMMSIMRTTNELQRAVYKNLLKEKDDVLEYLMKQPNIMPRLNDRILKGEQSDYIPMTGDVLPSLKEETFGALSKAGMASTLADHMKYLSLKDSEKNQLNVLTVWVVADLETEQGREALLSAVSHVKTSSLLRVGVIHNAAKVGKITKIVQAALDTFDSKAAKLLLLKVLKEDTVKRLESGKKKLSDYDIPGADMKLLETLQEDYHRKNVFEIHAMFCKKALAMKPGQSAVVVNGKLIGPLDEKEHFGADDFNLLEKFTMSQYGEKMVNLYYSHMDVKNTPKVSDQVMKTVALLMTRSATKNRNKITFSGEKHSVIVAEPRRPDRPSFEITAVIEPATIGAQKIAPVLLVLQEVVNAKIRVFLNCVDKHSEMPQKSYFRMVMDPELRFDGDGKLSSGPIARFSNLPAEVILTMHHHIPDNWLIEPVESIYDLDNIKLSSVEAASVHSEFELDHLLLEGHCFEAFTGNPPRGMQLTLGTEQTPVVGDTIVMANLGYLQLKSNPGRWFLGLREGRSSDLYDIVSHEGTEQTGEGSIQVLIDSFQSKIVKLRVQKKPEMRHEELLESDGDDDDDGNGLWSSITKTFSPSPASSSGDDTEDETLNIFCLASGKKIVSTDIFAFDAEFIG